MPPVFVGLHAPPNVKKYGFVHRLTVFCELIVTHSRYRFIAHVQNVEYTVVSWGPRTGGHGVARVDSDHDVLSLPLLLMSLASCMFVLCMLISSHLS